MGTNGSHKCPVEITLDIIGGKWTPLILYYLLQGEKRFNELRKLLPDVSQRMLTLQLRELENYGIVNRVVYAEIPPRVEYSLTEVGKSLEPVLLTMLNWGNTFVKKKPANNTVALR